MVAARSVEADASGGRRGGRILKATGLRLVLQTAVLIVGFSVSGHAQERMTSAKGGLEAKLEYCKTCHGMSGQGYLGYFPMPRLAGQQPEYIEAQLRAFIERRRSNPVMRNVAHVLSPSMVTALASHFRNLNPPPFGGAPRGAIATGKKIYEEGLPESNVPACSACHGPKGEGNPTSVYPSLGGQYSSYIGKALHAFRAGERGNEGGAEIMRTIVSRMSEEEINAVADFVSGLH